MSPKDVRSAVDAATDEGHQHIAVSISAMRGEFERCAEDD
jgi:hypothetical protein